MFLLPVVCLIGPEGNLPVFTGSYAAMPYRACLYQAIKHFCHIQILPKVPPSWITGDRTNMPGEYHNCQVHPALYILRFYPGSPGIYINTCIAEWLCQRYRNTMPLY
jgi:hypothetical protein